MQRREVRPHGGGRGVYPEGDGVAVEVCARHGGGSQQPLHAAELARAAAAPVVLREWVGLPVEELLGGVVVRVVLLGLEAHVRRAEQVEG